MRIQKLLMMVYIAALGGAVFQQAKADDTEIQKRAREALRQSMATNVPPEAPATPAMPAITNAPAVAAPAPVATPPPDAVPSPAMPVEPAPAAPIMAAPDAAPTANQSVEEQLRENVRKTIAEEQARKGKAVVSSSRPAAPVTPVYPLYIAPGNPEATPLPPVAPVVPEIVPASTPTPTTEAGMAEANSTNGLPADVDQELREKMRRQMELDAQNKTPRPAAKSAQVATIYGNTPPGGSPAAMVPGSKDDRLYQLLQQYKADQITPAEYHRKRAEILAEP